MYLEVKDVKKSYGEDGSYMEVLKGISTAVAKGRCVLSMDRAVPANQLFKCNRRSGQDRLRFH